MKVINIKMSQINEPENAIRINPNDLELKYLAGSIEKIGLINPITVQEIKKGQYEVVAGHRRFLATQIAEKKEIACNIITNNKEAATAIKITENISRRAITDYEGIIAIANYIKKYNLTDHEAAKTLGIARHTLMDYMVLANAPDDIKMHLHRKDINRAVAMQLMKIKNTEDRLEITKRTIDFRWSKSSTQNAVGFYIQQKEIEKNKENIPELKNYKPVERKQTFSCQMCETEMLAEQIQEVFLCNDCRQIVEDYRTATKEEKKKMETKTG